MLHSDDIPEKPKVEGTTKSIYGKWWKWWNTDSADVFEAGKVSDVAQEFGQGRFSDVVVKCFSKRYPLHRIILIQSPFFKRLFLNDDKSKEINLEIENDDRLCLEGLEIALRDLYCSQDRQKLISTENALLVLSFACFLELNDLADYCSDLILTRMNAATIHVMILSIDRLASQNIQTAYGDAHAYNSLLASHHDNLENCCLSYVLQLTCAIGFESTKTYADSEPKIFIPGSQWKSAELLLASLSTSWIKKVLEYHTISIESEFARYSTIKRIFEYKEGELPVKDEEENEHIVKESDDSQCGEDKESQNYISNILDSVLPSQKKRKRSYSVDKNGEFEADKCLILKNSVNYIHMSFSDLRTCRNDSLVPEETVLKSFWKQAELVNGIGVPRMHVQPFRFSVRFLETGGLFDESKPEKTFSSDPIQCAGAQYRVILCKSDNQSTPENLEDCIVVEDVQIRSSKMNIKVLLQRTRSSSNNLHKDKFEISYKLYCFDRHAFIKGKIQDAAFFEPITVCNFDGSGVAKPLPNGMIHMEESQKKKAKNPSCDFWVSVIIHFNLKT